MVLRFYGRTGGGGRAKIRPNRRKNPPALLDLLNCATLLNSRSKMWPTPVPPIAVTPVNPTSFGVDHPRRLRQT
jgi:hypothetical protein